ncbi:MAG: hypothetical protein ABF297_11925 [Thiogranum sp.]
MNRTTLAVVILFSLAGPASVLAEEQAVAEATVSDTEVSTAEDAGSSRPMRGMGMGMGMGKGMMQKGKGQHGKGHGGMKHGGGHQGGGHSEKHRQVVQRLDMIEARMAKIEAMLEILMRR